MKNLLRAQRYSPPKHRGLASSKRVATQTAPQPVLSQVPPPVVETKVHEMKVHETKSERCWVCGGALHSLKSLKGATRRLARSRDAIPVDVEYVEMLRRWDERLSVRHG